MQPEKDTVRKLEEDLSIIKDAIRSNNGFIRRILAAPVLGAFFLAFGVAGIVVLLAWEYTLSRFETLQTVPTHVLGILIAATVMAVAGLGAWKITAISKGSGAIDERYTWMDVTQELSGHPVFFHQILVVFGTIILSIVVGRVGSGYLISGIVAGGFGTVFMLYAVAFLLTEYTFITVWLYLYTIITFLDLGVSPLIMAAIGFGGGFCLFGLYCLTAARTQPVPNPYPTRTQGRFLSIISQFFQFQPCALRLFFLTFMECGLIGITAVILAQTSGFEIANMIVTVFTVMLPVSRKIPAPLIVAAALTPGLLV